MSQYKYKPTVVTATGTWTGDTMSVLGGVCTQIYAKSATSTTTFDLKIQDVENIELRKFTAVVGEVNDLMKWSAQGVLTVTIENASADETFDVIVVVEEF
jgi:hypothetical protein